MKSTQQLLFGEFPRSVGVTTPDWDGVELTQYLVHSSGGMDGVVDKISGERNLYSSVSSYPQYQQDDSTRGYEISTDKVSFDFDSTAKSHKDNQRWDSAEIPDGVGDRWVFDHLSEKDVRESVFGKVCDEVRVFAQACVEESIPIVGVFSGLGLHIYQLYERTRTRVEDKLRTISAMWIDRMGFDTVDTQATGQPFRLMRYPNYERVIHGVDRKSTGVYTIPIKRSELAEIDPKTLCELSRTPRSINALTNESRNPMEIQEDYLGPMSGSSIDQREMREIPESEIGDGVINEIIKRFTRMPCVWKRALTPNPCNDVRVKVAVMLLNAGFSTTETVDLIERIGWVNFDRSKTEYQVEKLYESGKGDWSCLSMQKRGLCVMADEKKECPTYGYRGGNSSDG